MIYLLHIFGRKARIRTWEKGDLLYLDKKSEVRFAKYGIEYATLDGWNMSEVFISFAGSDAVYAISYMNVINNYTDSWRTRYDTCKKQMGTDPGFKRIPDNDTCDVPSEKKNIMFDGKRIEELTETECSVYLKLVLDQEKYEIADLIRKQQEKFR